MISFFVANRFTASRKASRFLSLISVISITGIAIGVATLIIALTVLSGFEKTIADKIVQFNSHIQITAFSNHTLPDYRFVRPVLVKKLEPHAAGVSPFFAQLAIIKSRRYTDGITIKGILPEYDVSNIGKYIVTGSGDLDYRETDPKILIGKKLAQKLFVKTGDKITLFTLRNNQEPSPENPPGIKQFIVTGIFESGMAEYDDDYAYLNLKNAQELLDVDNRINGYDIKVRDISRIDSLTANLNDYLNYPYYVRSIYNIYQNIFTWIDLQKRLIPISLILIVVVAVFNIIGTLLMIVLERTKAIGILKSLGASRKQIVSIFLLQGIYISLIGIVLGNIIAYILSRLQQEYNIISIPESVYFMSKAPVEIQLQNYLIISAATLLLSAFAAFIPSYIASRINPVNTIRFN